MEKDFELEFISTVLNSGQNVYKLYKKLNFGLNNILSHNV